MRRVVVLSVVLLTGCSVGPDYRKPELEAMSGKWLNPLAPGPVAGAWWKSLGDPQLDRLVAAALTRNLDVHEAEARLREARANRDAAAGGALPQVNATGSATRQSLSAEGQLPIGQIPGVDREFSLFNVGFDASWEIDFWGRNRRAVEAATARERASEARLDDVRLQTIAEVVRSYADLRAAQGRGALLGEESVARGTAAGLTDLRAKAGESSRSEAEVARQRAAAALAAMPEANSAAAAASYRLALLTGQPPEAGVALAASPAPVPDPPALVAGDVRSELLRRRPDVRGAEAELAATTADVGVATADLFPRFTLLGSLGQQARSVGDLASGNATRFSIGPSFSWPLFDFGRIRAQIRGANARRDIALARYEKAALGALADSEAAANRYAAAVNARADRAEALTYAVEAERLARLRFERGEDDRLQLLEATSARIAAAQQSLAAEADAVSAYVALAKALGSS